MRELIYLSRSRLNAFYPKRQPRLSSASVELNAKVAKVTLTGPSTTGTVEAEVKKFQQVIRHLERDAAHFTAPGLQIGQWIFFDLEMGYGTSHNDSRLPGLDDVLFFYGSVRGEDRPVGSSLDLLLCGSTEHLLTKAASAGRMGSGTGWLHELILQVEEYDSLGKTEIPEALTPEAIAMARVNTPEMIVRWVFDVIARHHHPSQRARFQGLARVNLIVPDNTIVPRLVVATPLYVQFASPKPLRWITRFRMHRDLCRRYGKPWFKWRPDLPPHERDRVYDPITTKQ